ncbi:Ubiquitin carboxyl-terminal hydrolase 8 [Portunus trituberculatus]|uniref:ubiquitinyl hydrolase 1 n=2 Tax=Portunus trituberculatus TaxID=210409 RepID=A0A5B7DHX5_PORTR|nr:Ubiquitin carboxyl-terminal hydrolase 8 [Portunus trituberculatus]
MKKQQNFVDFPMESLDLTKYTCFNNRYTKFDLYAVCNHYGTMDGGHYTAFCRSPINNKTWYKFDDHEVYEHCSVKTSAAYLLFYEATNTSMHINNLV